MILHDRRARNRVVADDACMIVIRPYRAYPYRERERADPRRERSCSLTLAVRTVHLAEMSEPTSAPTILVVDDDPHILLALRLALQSRGYVVRAVPNGPSALAAAQDARPDAVVVDLAMPRMDGVEVIERLRTWTRIPIIVLSAHTDEANKVRALDAGADDFVD